MNEKKVEYILQTKLISRKKFELMMATPYSDIFKKHEEKEEKILCEKASSILNVSEKYLNEDYHFKFIYNFGNLIIISLSFIFAFIPFVILRPFYCPIVISFWIDFVLIVLNLLLIAIYRKFLLHYAFYLSTIISGFFMGYSILLLFFS